MKKRKNHPNRMSRNKIGLGRIKHEHDYSGLLASVRQSFAVATAAWQGDRARLFCTDAQDLWETYLDSMPTHRQVHNCSCCRRFIETYGGLVMINEHGNMVPAMWSPAYVPDFYSEVFSELNTAVQKAKVTGVFLDKREVWGVPETGSWSHLSVVPPSSLVYRERALTPGQAMAAKRENFKTVLNALAELGAPHLDEGLRVLKSGQLSRTEKFIGPMQWLRDLHDRPRGVRGQNVLWNAIARAPEGYCHPRSSVIAPLLEDVARGLPFTALKARFESKIGPLAYQRPQAAPAAGNVRAAEVLFDKLGLAPALERRFAWFNECVELWSPPVSGTASSGTGGVFGHLRTKKPGRVLRTELPAGVMTWRKFSEMVMPEAEAMEFMVPASGRFMALTTAVHADAPLLFKWDNPVAWYVYPSGSPAVQWRLRAHDWRKVNGVVPLPTLWSQSNPQPHLGEGVMLVLDGAVDSRSDCGNALFPECLRGDLHGVRSTIEAYSRTAVVSGKEEASACGYDIRNAKGGADCTIRAYMNGDWTTYKIDRWD